MVRSPKGKPADKMDVPPGTLDLLILTILRREPLHGYGIAQRLSALSNGALQINPGSMFPALYALERDGKLRSEERLSENNRKAKFYVLTPLGRKQLEREEQRWERVIMTISSVLEGA